MNTIDISSPQLQVKCDDAGEAGLTLVFVETDLSTTPTISLISLISSITVTTPTVIVTLLSLISGEVEQLEQLRSVRFVATSYRRLFCPM